MPPESYRPFDRRGRELGARRSPPARFSSLPTCRESLQQQKPKQSKTPLTQITLQNRFGWLCTVLLHSSFCLLPLTRRGFGCLSPAFRGSKFRVRGSRFGSYHKYAE